MKQNKDEKEQIKNGDAEDDSPHSRMRPDERPIGIGQNGNHHVNNRQSEESMKNVVVRSCIISGREREMNKDLVIFNEQGSREGGKGIGKEDTHNL